jgi:hypothetical protein
MGTCSYQRNFKLGKHPVTIEKMAFLRTPGRDVGKRRHYEVRDAGGRRRYRRELRSGVCRVGEFRLMVCRGGGVHVKV